MIPKIIHYCWFGKGNMPKLAIRCMKSWREFLPDYEIQRWDESVFDVNQIPYVKEAYQSRKYAFVSDYVRLYALYHHGGIYLDTDVEMIRNLDSFLVYPAFSGFESDTEVPTGIIGSEPNGIWVKEQLDYYYNRNFKLPNGKYDIRSNVVVISQNMLEHGFLLNNCYQVYNNCIHIFPKDYFCPKSRTGVITLTNHTHCIHYFTGSWQPIHLRMKRYLFNRIIGARITDKLVTLKRRFLKKAHVLL